MFAVSEVHPFADGNGRVSRALLNAELSAAGQCRTLVPLCFRSDWSTMPRTLAQLGPTNALVPSDEAEERGLILEDPLP